MRNSNNSYLVQLVALCICTIITANVFAQDKKIIDQVVAIVGNKIVLESDIEVQYLQGKAQNITDDGSLRCQIMEQMLFEKLLNTRAEIDSIAVSEDEVNGEIDGRVNYFLGLFGGDVQKMEEYYGKSLVEIKEQFRDDVRSQLLIRRMQAKVLGTQKASPMEVRAYFNKIPKDSLPYLNAQIELGEIVFKPKMSKETKEATIKKLLDIKKQIEDGADFAKLATKYSQDPGSAVNGGDLGFVSRGQFVPEFEGAAFKLKPNEMSGIVESPFGFHLIQLIERRGDKIHARHILLKADIGSAEMDIAKSRADSIRKIFLADTLNFQELVEKYSEDEEGKKRGGNIYNPKDNTTSFEISELEPSTYFSVDNVPVGELSKPVETTQKDGSKVYRLLYVFDRTKPHKANLTDDYTRFAGVVENQKQQESLVKWANKYIPETYIKIDDNYKGCEQLDKWLPKN